MTASLQGGEAVVVTSAAREPQRRRVRPPVPVRQWRTEHPVIELEERNGERSRTEPNHREAAREAGTEEEAPTAAL